MPPWTLWLWVHAAIIEAKQCIASNRSRICVKVYMGKWGSSYQAESAPLYVSGMLRGFLVMAGEAVLEK
jgi:hypothetical protein